MAGPNDSGERLAAPGPTALERAQAHYLDELRANRQPNIEDYIQRLPEHRRTLLEFAFYAETIAAGLPDFDPVPPARLSPHAQQALAWIADASARGEAQVPDGTVPDRPGRQRGERAPAGLLVAARTAHLAPAMLAQRVGLTEDVLALLDQRMLLPETIPDALIARLADALNLPARDVTRSLRRSSSARRVAESGAAYGRRQQSQPPRVAFIEAVHASTLDDERKREWAALVAAEAHGAGPP